MSVPPQTMESLVRAVGELAEAVSDARTIAPELRKDLDETLEQLGNLLGGHHPSGGPRTALHSGEHETHAARVLQALRRRPGLAAAVKQALHTTPIVHPWLACPDLVDGVAKQYLRRDVTGINIIDVCGSSENLGPHGLFGWRTRWRWSVRIPTGNVSVVSGIDLPLGICEGPSDPHEAVTEVAAALAQADMMLLEVAPGTMFLDPDDHPGKVPDGTP